MPIYAATLEPGFGPGDRANANQANANAVQARANAGNADQDAARKAWELQQQKGLADLVSKYTTTQLSEDGKTATPVTNWGGLFKDPAVAQGGLGKALMAQWIQSGTDQSNAMATTAKNTRVSSAVGTDLSQYLPSGQPPVSTTGQPSAQPSATPGWSDQDISALRTTLGGKPSAPTPAPWMAGNGSRSTPQTQAGAPRNAALATPDQPAVGDQPGQVTVTAPQGGAAGSGTFSLPPDNLQTDRPPSPVVPTDLFNRIERTQGPIGGNGGSPQIPDNLIPTNPQELERFRQGAQHESGIFLPPGASRDQIGQAFGVALQKRSAALMASAGTDTDKMIAAQGALQALPNSMAAEWNKGGIGQQGNILNQKGEAQEQSIKGAHFGWDQAGRQSIEKAGLDPTKVTPSQAVDLVSRKGALDGMGDMIAARKDDLLGVNGGQAQLAATTAVLKNLATVEGVGTIDGNNRMDQLLQLDPNVQQAFQHGGPSDAAKAFVNSFGSDPAKGFAALQKFYQDTKTDGVLINQFKAAMPKFQSPNDPTFKSLPSGAKFVGPDGNVRTKH